MWLLQPFPVARDQNPSLESSVSSVPSGTWLSPSAGAGNGPVIAGAFGIGVPGAVVWVFGAGAAGAVGVVALA